jgi:hypothetical protein
MTPYPPTIDAMDLDTDYSVTVSLQVPENVTGWSVVFAVAPEDGSAPETVVKSSAAATITATNTVAGIWQFRLSPDLDGLTAGNYHARFRRVDAGARDTLLKVNLGVVGDGAAAP